MKIDLFFQLFNTILLFIIIIAIIVGTAYLQKYFAKSKHKWLGYIIPAIFFISSLFTALGTLVFTSFFGSDGFNLTLGSLLAALLIALLMSIPGIITLLIFKKELRKNNNETELKKMRIEDLD